MNEKLQTPKQKRFPILDKRKKKWLREIKYDKNLLYMNI